MKGNYVKIKVAPTERYQWLCTKRNKPTLGRQEEIRALDQRAYGEHILPRLRFPRLTFAAYRALYPSVTHYSVVRASPEAAWTFNTAGSLAELRPLREVRWYPVNVTDFVAPEAFHTGPNGPAVKIS